MSTKKIIAVFGATGAQGGGLAKAILNDANSEFAVRAVTRDVNSDKAKELAALGAELVSADIDDQDSIRKALESVYGAFFVTFFWAHFSPAKEIDEVNKLAAAAKDAGVEHVIWSTLEDTREFIPLSDDRMPTLQGEYKVPHYDGKGQSDKIFTELGVPTTFLLTSFYWDNFIHFGMGPKKGPEGELLLTLPMGNKRLPGIAAEDIGKAAYGIFKRGKEMIGKRIGIAGEHLTGEQMSSKMSKALGQNVRYNSITPETYRSFGFPGADDLGNMFQFKHDFEKEYTGARDIEFTKKLNPELLDFDSWLKKNGSKISVE